MSDTLACICQAILSIAFGYSGISKIYLPKARLVSLGQTGIADLPDAMIRFIGVTETLGTIGLIFSLVTNVLTYLTAVTAIGFALIVILAIPIHYRRKEYAAVLLNVFLLALSAMLAFASWQN